MRYGCMELLALVGLVAVCGCCGPRRVEKDEHLMVIEALRSYVRIVTHERVYKVVTTAGSEMYPPGTSRIRLRDGGTVILTNRVTIVAGEETRIGEAAYSGTADKPRVLFVSDNGAVEEGEQ